MEIARPARCDPTLLSELAEICGREHVSVNDPDRIAYARDMWPRSLIRQRAGGLDHLPDLVVWPGTADQVGQVVRVANAWRLPVVPFGAGSGVCGGTLPVRGGMVVDLKRLNRILGITPEDCLLEVEAGVVGENLERELNRRGWTLGHFPSSIYCSTVGGWIATRSAGQCSSRFGKIEDLVRSLTFVDSEGELRSTPFSPPGFSNWSLDPLLVGSEGTLGIVVSAALVLRPIPSGRWFGAFKFPDQENGLQVMRLALREGLRPSVLRLYDGFETLMARTGSGDGTLEDPLHGAVGTHVPDPLRRMLSGSLRLVLRSPRWLNRLSVFLPRGCLLVVVYEGESEERALGAARVAEICGRAGASDLGEGPARHWWNQRYAVSYKQSPVFSAGAWVDTMEVATTWDKLANLHSAVRRATSSLAFVTAHFSHAYREGCSIYFTLAAAAADDLAAVELYDRVWDAAQEAVLREGAVISHHHGVGFSKQRYLVRQQGEASVLAAAVKAAFDPHDRFNPGKLGLREDSEDR